MCESKKNHVTVNRRRLFQVAGLYALSATLSTALSACSLFTEAEPAEPLTPRQPEPAPQTRANTTQSEALPKAARERFAYDSNWASIWNTITDNQNYCDSFDNMIDGFAQNNGGLRVNAIQCGGGNQPLLPIWQSRMQQAQRPDAALVLGETPIAELMSANLLDPLDDLMLASTYSQANTWPSKLLNAVVYEGKTYGLPLFLAPYALYYNADIFEKKGISTDRKDFPKTWDELKRVSKELTEWNGDSLRSAGFIPSLSGSDLPLWFALNGGGMFDPLNNKYVIDQEQNIETIQFFLDWYRTNYRADGAKIRAVSGFRGQSSFLETPKAFHRGALAIADSSILASDSLITQTPSVAPKNWNVAAYPIGPSGSAAVTTAITIWAILASNSPHRDDAFKYLDYAGGAGIVNTLTYDFGTFVPGSKAITKPPTSKAVEQARGATFVAEWLAFFLQQRENVVALDTSPVAGFATEILNSQIDEVIQDKASPAAALKQAQKACQDKLEQATKK